MHTQTLQLGQKQFVVVEREDFDRLVSAAGFRHGQLPPLPPADKDGNRPAIEYARISLARKIILARRGLNWSQSELASRAGLRVETINRIERGKNERNRLSRANGGRAVAGLRTRPAHEPPPALRAGELHSVE